MHNGATIRLAGVVMCLLIGTIAYGQQSTGTHTKAVPQGAARTTLYSETELEQITPSTPNPYLAWLPAGVEPDWLYWRSWAAIQSQKRAAAAAGRSSAAKLLNVPESEANNTFATADPVGGFGTDTGDDPAADVTGDFPGPPAPVAAGPFAENDGSIPLATATGLTAGNAITVSGTIGDGPHGSGGTGSGDYDFFAVTGVVAGQSIVVDVDTPMPFDPLDPTVGIFDSSGNFLDFNDDDAFSFDSFIDFTAPADGDYFISLGGFFNFNFFPNVPANPFDSGSGPGAGSEGTYDIIIGLDSLGGDIFSFTGRAGDVIGLSGSGPVNHVALFSPTQQLQVFSDQDVSFIYPFTSTLPGGGTSVLAYVLPETGTYFAKVTSLGSGAYTLQMRAFRPPLESGAPGAHQILFLDFDGATIDTSIFGGPGVSVLSPLSSFLTAWGLTAMDESAVIDAIIASVQESHDIDLRIPGGNNFAFDVEILNSRDHADPLGGPNVSRLIIGGTIAESGVATIGIAEFIDPGNFETEGSALILLDLLSGPGGDQNSLNSIPVDMGSSKIALVGTGVGNIAAHEAGHLFGNFHTDNIFTPPNLMDQGGNLPNTVGIGPDFIFGSPDDVDVDFGPDLYIANEGFRGTEDTLNLTAFGLTTPRGALAIPLVAWPVAIALLLTGIYTVRRVRKRMR